jgi:hypothetical protein
VTEEPGSARVRAIWLSSSHETMNFTDCSEPVVEQLRAEGQRCDDELLSLTTPLLRRHLNPFGRYYFDLVRMRQDGGQLVELPSEPSASERVGA